MIEKHSQTTPVDLASPQRQSLWAVFFLALRTLRQIGFVQLALFVGFAVARAPSLPILIGIVTLAGIALFFVAVLRWMRYTFMLEGDEVVVRRGVLSQQTLTVPLDRVQSVSLEQKLLHRLVSLVQVSLDTAGAEEAEFVIDAIDQSVAEELQRVTAEHRSEKREVGSDASLSTEPQPPPPEQRLIHHSRKRIATVALTEMPFAGLVLLAPLWAVAGDLRTYIPFDPPALEDASAGWWLAWAIPLMLLAGLLLSVLLNVVRVVLTEWELTLTATAAGLRRNAGLLSKKSVAATVPRIQRVTTTQRPLERFVDLRTVDLQTIGNARLHLPGCRADEVDRVRRLAFASSARVVDPQCVVSAKAVFLNTRNMAVAAAVLAGGAFLVVDAWALLFFLAVPYQWWVTRRRTAFRRWGVNAEAASDYHRLFAWTQHELLLRKVNGVTVRQGLFERKHGLATVQLRSAAGAVSVGMIPLDQAQAVRDHALRVVETDSQAWM